jgi:uncharacterized surface protein with fasciclin (FAS1) repeats
MRKSYQTSALNTNKVPQRKMKWILSIFQLFSVLCTTVAQQQQQNVYLIAQSLPETFSTLVRGLMVADLAEALQDPNLGSTVFAPTNDAFAALNSLNLPSANTVTLFRDPDWQPHLQNLLLYHVLPGSQVLAQDVTDGLTVTMLNGEDVTFSVSQEDGTVSLNSAAKVVTADVSASNGQFFFWRLIMFYHSIVCGNTIIHFSPTPHNFNGCFSHHDNCLCRYHTCH